MRELHGTKMSRRRAATMIGGSAAALFITGTPARLQAEKPAMLQRPIPSSGERLPVVGLGSWQVFDVGRGANERQPLEEVLSRFVALGGRVVDSSPMYGRAEEVIGDIAAKLHLRDA